MKTKRAMIISALLVMCIVLVGTIFKTTNQKKTNKDIFVKDKSTTIPIVDAIEAPKEDVKTVEVAEIKMDVDLKDIGNKIEEQIIYEQLPKQPVKPKNTPPEKKPQTNDDFEDMRKEPKYNEEEVIYIPEIEEYEPMSESDTKSSSEESNLVPDSQNPFLHDNIPNNGVGGEMSGEDYYEDGVPAGEGDKF